MARASSHRHTQMREDEKARWSAQNAACHICGEATIDWDAPADAKTDDSFEVDHDKSVKRYPHLEFEPTNRFPSHRRCNRHKSEGASRPGIGITSEAW